MGKKTKINRLTRKHVIFKQIYICDPDIDLSNKKYYTLDNILICTTKFMIRKVKNRKMVINFDYKRNTSSLAFNFIAGRVANIKIGRSSNG